MRRVIVCLVCAVLMACDAGNKYSTRYPCNFVFYLNLYTSSALSRAVGNPGDFVMVHPETAQGAIHLMLTPNHGHWEKSDTDLIMRTAITGERISYNQMGAAQALIIGHSRYFGLKAFDRQCPNCLNDYGSPRYTLQWNPRNDQQVVCYKCRRIYSLVGDDAFPIEGGKKGDEPLMQYRFEVVGNNEKLYVHN